MGTHAQEPDFVDASDRAAAGADLDHVDHRRFDWQAGALLETMYACRFHLSSDRRGAVLNQARLGGGAAHVEADHV